ncbi:apolipoprotein N-acyltransferase [Marinobacter nanhaiticus D15-8W]|uniref:Apolipoprotein N-acyltransferase n=1 Tax=Marinobacter nanhaiticus D15-8W TaxID=626887 RepID=N6WP63_9GAMM|nr:apolipoprotein N-acyltransferase [Marinobacter nanhaiticus]ENO13336.1 apolipoprotein N-acyltransferase [Marinobacter nanhaiticus D15-8W]BES70704.1 apolipoprotein N-acyltransferase [Marinobacter nanhaiticus D15-8W]
MSLDDNRLSWLRALALIIGGGLQTLTFSPFGLTWFGPLSVLIILLAAMALPAGKLFRAGWLMGAGLFGSGASWVYISISQYGNTSEPLAVLLTAIFVAGLALFPAITFWGWGKLSGEGHVRRLILFPAIWIIGDWVRSWLLTGFPWLYLGTGQVDGPLASLAPIMGVHGVTLLVVATGAALYILIDLGRRKQTIPAVTVAGIALLPWVLGPLLSPVSWTERAEKPLSIAAMQGNIPQQIKWDPEFLEQQIVTYLRMSDEDWNRDLILWPETAIPITQDQAGPLIDSISKRLGPDSTLITGIPWYGFSDSLEDFTFRNSIMAIGNGEGMYYKQKLVPFGEYVPLQQYLRGLIGFFDLPMSSFSRGPSDQPPLTAGQYRAMPFICYEIAYPDFVARNAWNTGFLVTISNDGWFGHSIGPLQHLQIARMRALETGRFVLRGTNNGVTAIIDDKGRITQRIPQFERDVLRGELYPVTGATPYMATGSWPALILALILIVFARPRRIPQPSHQTHAG